MYIPQVKVFIANVICFLSMGSYNTKECDQLIDISTYHIILVLRHYRLHILFDHYMVSQYSHQFGRNKVQNNGSETMNNLHKLKAGIRLHSKQYNNLF